MRALSLRLPAEVYSLILCVFLFTIGAFLVLPILSLFLQEKLSLTTAQIGFLMSIKLWGQWGGALLGGKVSDKIGPKLTLVLGLVLRIVSFLTIVRAEDYSTVLLGVSLLGLSAALFSPASKAALSYLSTAENRVLVFSLRETAVNLGIALGPLIGFLVGKSHFVALFHSGAILYGLIAVLALIIVPSVTFGASETENASESSKALFTPQIFWLIALYGFYFIFIAHLEMLFPLYAGKSFGADKSFLVFLINAVVIILTQVPIAARLSKTPFEKVFLLSLLCFAGAFLTMGLTDTSSPFLFAIVLFSLGETIAGPRIETEFANQFSLKHIGYGMGVLGFSAGIGSTLGSYGGGLLFDFLNGGSLYWMTVAALAIVPLPFMLLNRRTA